VQFQIGLALRARPILELLARLLPELYSTRSNYYYQSYSWLTNWTPAARWSDFVITRMITYRIGLHSVLLPLPIKCYQHWPVSRGSEWGVYMSVFDKSHLIFLSVVGNLFFLLPLVSNIFSPFVASRLTPFTVVVTLINILWTSSPTEEKLTNPSQAWWSCSKLLLKRWGEHQAKELHIRHSLVDELGVRKFV